MLQYVFNSVGFERMRNFVKKLVINITFDVRNVLIEKGVVYLWRMPLGTNTHYITAPEHTHENCNAQTRKRRNDLLALYTSVN